MEVVFIQPENALTGVRQVQDLMGTRAGLVQVCDPYLAPRTPDYLAQLTSASEVRVLTRNIDKENTLKRDLKSLALELGVPVEIRRVGSRVLHDRYLIDDTDMLILGTSFNGIGLKQSMVVTAVRWVPDLSPRVVGLSPQGWEDDHNEAEKAYSGAGGSQGP